ncbi:MAG: type IV secretory system conjugative DNA transfer family protein [Candidatus Vogelbacteria bacterium]|nr:type IV secretory system conjugative DNA transfer family protein [Candidatus Vogelbacteria bacterium]
MDPFLLTIGALGTVFLVSGVALLVMYILRQRKIESLNLKLLLITVPRPEEKEGSNQLDAIASTEQLMVALAGISRSFVFEVVVQNAGEEILFYLAVPRSQLTSAKTQIEGLFPRAEVTEISDYTIFHPDGGSAAAHLTLTENEALPLRTYKEAGVDTFAAIVNTLSHLRESGDGATIQLVVTPTDNSIKKTLAKMVEQLKQGNSFSSLVKKGNLSLEVVAKALMSDKSSTKKDKSENKIVDEEAVKALSLKMAKPLFKVNIRVITASDTTAVAEDLLLAIAGQFNQFASPYRNNFKLVKARRPKKLLYQYIFREFDPSQAFTLNAEELASIFHLPTATTAGPRISWLNTKEAPPPPNLPRTGTLIAESIFRGETKPVYLSDADRRRHLYLIGQTGTGKSLSMLNMINQDLLNDKGLCLIDPHGDLVDAVLERVPKSRIDDVIVFNPGDLARPLGLNMLEYNFDRPEEKTFIVNEIQSIFNQLFDKETMGPMFEQYMRNALLLLMEDANPAKGGESATLMEVSRLFTDTEFRNRKLARITNPSVIDFWTKEAVKTSGEQGLANMTPYITSKFGNFVANDYMRPIIGQPQSAFNFRTVMDEGKILLVNLAKGKIGDINSGLLGMIITGRLLLAALSRSDIPETERRDFNLYIDEFQNYTTDSISTILSEARKYRLNLTIAHQFIAQLKDNIRESVFGNVGSIISFRVGTPDTEVLLKQFGSVFTSHDLVNNENRHGFARILINGEPSIPFSIQVPLPKLGSVEVKDKLKELSRLTYGRDLTRIEGDILTRLRS